MEGNSRIVDSEIDLKEIFLILKKRLWLIILITLLTVILTAIISYYFLTPVYEASTELLVNQSESNKETIYSYTDIQTDLKLMNTYNVIINSHRIIDEVISKYDINLTYSQLIGRINVSTVKDSQVISINVTDTDYSNAVLIANSIAKTFQKEIVNIMNVDNVQILTMAKSIDNPSPIKPSPKLNIAIAFVIGLLIGTMLSMLLEYLDNSIKTEADVVKILGYPVLGSINYMKDKKENSKAYKSSNSVLQGGEKVYEIEG